MPKHSEDGRMSNDYKEYKPPAGTLEIKDIGSESQIRIDETVSSTVILRLIKQMITEMGLTEGEIKSKDGPRIEFDLFAGDVVSINLKFHEQNIENEFRFKSNYIDGVPNAPEATPPSQLGGKVGEYAEALENKFGVIFDFAELDGASIGYESIVDFEFEYDGSTTKSRIVNTEL